MKYSHYCKYTCCFCKGKLKQKTTKRVRKTGILNKKKLTTFSCANCNERVYSLMNLGYITSSRFEMAYITETGKPFWYEVGLEGYRIAISFITKKCYISKANTRLEFNSMGQKVPFNTYNNIGYIKEIPIIDYTDPEAILRKIKLLLTFS